jgi:hypothetical protein
MAPRLISLADRLRAIAWLEPGDDRTNAVLLDMLRSREFRGSVRSAAYRAAAAHPAVPLAGSADQPPGEGSERPPRTPPPAPGPAPSVAGTRVTPLAPRPIPAPGPSAHSILVGNESAPARTPLPLIDNGKARAVLTSLAATQRPEGPIDTSALLKRMSRGLPLSRLHRLRVWSVRRGLQLLVDCSPAMTPVRYDVEGAAGRLELILGGTRLQRFDFDSCPSRGVGAGERSGWKQWQTPDPDIPVVMLTDLGCAGPRSNPDWASPEEWARFADFARNAGMALVALVPYPVRRVPFMLTRRITVVPWCEDLSAARVRRILRDARTKR